MIQNCMFLIKPYQILPFSKLKISTRHAFNGNNTSVRCYVYHLKLYLPDSHQKKSDSPVIKVNTEYK